MSPARRRGRAAWFVPWNPITSLGSSITSPCIASVRSTELSSPEDAAVVLLDRRQQRLDLRRGGQRIETMELEVPVPPVHGPLATGLRVMNADDREPGPVRSEVGSPWRPAFEDGHEPIGDV